MKQVIFFLIHFTSLAVFAMQKDSIPRPDTIPTKQLKEVVVTAKRPFIEKQVDKTVLHVQNDLMASGGNVFEVLQHAPGVSVQNEETLGMTGKTGVNVLVDGRAIMLGVKDLAAYLKSLPASLVDKIEIIPNPSARYDAQGNAGIINIRLKKNTAKGTNGNLTTSYTVRDHYNLDLSGNVNHRNGHWNLFANAGAGKALQHTTGNIVRIVQNNGINKVFENNTLDKDASRRLNFFAGADWYLDKKNTFGLLIKSNNYENPMLTPGVTLVKSNNQLDSSLQTVNDNLAKNQLTNMNLNYRFADTLGTELNIDADYVDFNNTSSSNLTTSLFNNQHIQYGYAATRQAVVTRINIYGIKADLAMAIKPIGAKLEAGIKMNSAKTVNNQAASGFQNGMMLPDTGRSNRFIYTEKLMAAYTSISRQYRKWEYKAGVRLEGSISKGKNTDLKGNRILNPDTAYLNLFPTVFVKYKFNDNNQFTWSFGRRINRPTYQELNPFQYQYDQYNSYRGNPFLLPEFTWNTEINYSYRGALETGFGYSYTRNFFQTISTQSGQETQASEANIGHETRYYLNISLGMPVTKWWNMYSNLTPFFKRFNGNIPAGRISNEAFGMGWYTSQQFNLPKGYKLQLSSWGSIHTRDALYSTKWLGSLDAGLGKSFFQEKLRFRVTMIDIFNTQRWDQQVKFANMDYSFHRKWESQGLRLQLNWKFGSTQYNQRERKLGAEAEMNRIK
jgi:outer membrane receptor protein involved in Fe transport